MRTKNRITNHGHAEIVTSIIPQDQGATRMWANAQRDGRPAKHRWHPLFNAAKFG